jgi:hypothetical protein
MIDYLDRVYLDLTARPPGRYPLDNLREPDRFIQAVKELIDGEWIHDICFTADYKTLIIPEAIP